MPIIRFTLYLDPSVSRDIRNIFLHVNEMRKNELALQGTELIGERGIAVDASYAVFGEKGHVILR
jgi:hypothetical protein